MRWWWGAVTLGLTLMVGCTLPRIIVLNDPLTARQHNDLGVAYEERGEYDLAEREYRRAAELDREWALPLVNLGNVTARQQNWQAATTFYRQALKRNPAYAEAMNNLAWTLVRGGQPAEALPWARQAVTLAAGNPSCWDTLAEVFLALGRTAEAHEAATRGLSLAPPPALRKALAEKLTSDEFSP